MLAIVHKLFVCVLCNSNDLLGKVGLKMKKSLIFVLVLMLAVLALVACSGEESELCLHEWQEEANEELLIRSATCKAPASYWSTCKLCGKKGEAFDFGERVEHSYIHNANDETLVSPATCTELAVYYESCEWCGAINTDKTFNSGICLPHNFINTANKDTIFKKSTCTNSNTYYKSCKECGILSTETFTLGPSLPHSDSQGDYMCDSCMKPLKVFDDVPVDNLTDIHHFIKN